MTGPTSPEAHIRTIPSVDLAFATHVAAIAASPGLTDANSLETRLRRLYPRVRVRARGLAGEPPAWYVYRDGAWRPDSEAPWWTDERLPRIEASVDGRLLCANSTARGLLGIDDEGVGAHLVDFVAPGTLDDATSLFAIVAAGNTMTATIRLRPTTGDVIAVEMRAWREDDRLIALLRLADDIEAEPADGASAQTLVCDPATDVVFARYARQTLARLPEPTPAELALRLRRLYPHAHVEERGDHWHATRDARSNAPQAGWWHDDGLPAVEYTADGLIVEANAPARRLLGEGIVGRHWQDLVTPGTDPQVVRMIELIREAGGAESRFRMPSADGSLVEFDSYTEIDPSTDALRTVMRPARRPDAAGDDGRPADGAPGASVAATSTTRAAGA